MYADNIVYLEDSTIIEHLSHQEHGAGREYYKVYMSQSEMSDENMGAKE